MPVIVLDIDEEWLNSLCQGSDESKSISYVIDLSSEKEIEKFLKWLEEKHLGVCWFIASAGYQESIDVLDISIAEWRKLFSVNLESSFLISQRIAQKMIEKGVQWSILNITSIHSGIIREIAHYSSAKAALEMLTKELAYRLAWNSIRVNAIAPWAILTPMITKELTDNESILRAWAQVPMGRLWRPEEIADAAIFLMSPKASYITGATLVVDGGYSLVI